MPLLSLPTELDRLELAIWEANSSPTPAAMPTIANSSCSARARSRTRYRWMTFENLMPGAGRVREPILQLVGAGAKPCSGS